jgi:flavin reductase (DIM6/NTAB) family NADH-FMN oxidoreductase RutF
MAAMEKTREPVDPGDYINAIAQHVSSVCVVTTEVGGERFGLTATAVSSVSAQPPRLLVCVNKKGLVASFDCLLGETSDQASHTILFGDVVATANRTGTDALLYGGRRFRQLRKMFSGTSGEDYL